MLGKEDRAEVMKMIGEAKVEIRNEINDMLNRNFDDKSNMKNDEETALSTLDYNIMLGKIDDPTEEEN